ncbi:MAG: hypothetical protein MHMPM18_000070 [Marteilia pararefringens]
MAQLKTSISRPVLCQYLLACTRRSSRSSAVAAAAALGELRTLKHEGGCGAGGLMLLKSDFRHHKFLRRVNKSLEEAPAAAAALTTTRRTKNNNNNNNNNNNSSGGGSCGTNPRRPADGATKLIMCQCATCEPFSYSTMQDNNGVGARVAIISLGG